MNNDKLQSEYWNKEAKRIAHIEITGPAQREINYFFNFINLKPAMEILDVGCGGGRLTIPLLKLGYKVTGTEVAEQNFEEIKDLVKSEPYAENLTLIKTNFEEPLAVQKFDLAILCNVIHHFDPAKKKQILENIVKALKPGGKIAIIEPNPYHPLYYPWYFLKEISGQDQGRWQVEKNFLESTPTKLQSLLNELEMQNIVMNRYAVIPSRVATISKSILTLNDILLKIPIVKNLSAFLWFKAEKN